MAAVDIESNIRAALARSDDELYIELGERLGQGAFLKDPRIEALKLLAKVRNRASGVICSSDTVRRLHEQHADAAQLVAAILDGVTSALSLLTLNVSPFTVAVLLVRTGVGEICRAAWSERKRNDDDD
jgi:hypothetical protein